MLGLDLKLDHLFRKVVVGVTKMILFGELVKGNNRAERIHSMRYEQLDPHLFIYFSKLRAQINQIILSLLP